MTFGKGHYQTAFPSPINVCFHVFNFSNNFSQQSGTTGTSIEYNGAECIPQKKKNNHQAFMALPISPTALRPGVLHLGTQVSVQQFLVRLGAIKAISWLRFWYGSPLDGPHLRAV